MTIRHMKIFVSVYQAQSITRAAEQLHMTQPAVSRAIQELEHYYGVCLFERIGRRICSTESAARLYAQALHIIETLDSMEKGLRDWDEFGVLRVGATIAIGNYELPRIARRFQAENPDVKLRARVAGASALIRAIMADEVDLALIEGGPLPGEMVAQPFGGDRLTLIAPVDSSIPENVSLRQVLEYPLLLREPGSAGRAAFDRLLQEHGLSVEPAWESVSTQALVRAVAAGLGVAVLPKLLIQQDVASGNVVPLTLKEPLRRTLNIVYHKRKYLSESMQRFIALCRETGEQ